MGVCKVFILILIQVVQGDSKGPIFEDGPGFDTAFKLFHGKDGIVPLSGHSSFRDDLEDETPQFNPLAGKVATISLSAFGPGGPFSFGPFSDKYKKQQKKPNKQEVRLYTKTLLWRSVTYSVFALFICSLGTHRNTRQLVTSG